MMVHACAGDRPRAFPCAVEGCPHSPRGARLIVHRADKQMTWVYLRVHQGNEWRWLLEYKY